MDNIKYPESVVKTAKDLQSAFKSFADLDAEIKEKQEILKAVPEQAAIKEAKDNLKKFLKNNATYQDLNEALKAKKDMLRNTNEYAELKEAREAKKAYQDSIKGGAKSIAQEILGKKLADTEVDEGDEE